MSESNKLIEAVAERFTEALCEVLTGAVQVGDEATIELVAEVLRNECDYELVASADRLAAVVRAARSAKAYIGTLGPISNPGSQRIWVELTKSLDDLDGIVAAEQPKATP
jgi:hypothetical protein